VVAEKLTYGQVQIDGFEVEHVRCVVLWGANPATSHGPFKWNAVLAAKRRGASLLVVDPRLSEPAKKADLHLALRPGTDGALALGLIHLIIAENLYDADFVARWTHGFEELRERARPYTPERVAGITGLEADDIRRFAHMYATARPAFLDVGNAVEHHTNSNGALRALMSLRALTGNLDVPGGDVLMRDLPLDTMALPEMLPAGMRVLGSERYPLYSAFAGFAIGDVLMEAITTGQPYPVRAALIMGTNPALTFPNSARMRHALSSLDLLVVSDMFMTATARRAHIVLPIASPYERTQLIANCAPFGADKPQWWIALRPQVLDPGERRSDWWVLRELAKRLGYGDYYPWECEEEAIDSLLEPTGLTVADLKANPDGIMWGAPAEFGSYRREGFRTPTGKVEFSSTIMASYGYDPLPNYEEPAESPISAPEMAVHYPLILNAGYRTGFHTNSRIENFPGQRHYLCEPVAELHTATAAQYGIADGDQVRVETPIGQITLKAKVLDAFVPGVVGVLQGWEEANANLLTNDRLTDPVYSTPALRAALCRIQRVG
jgi:anaerobic selenocysteine-containing dehydrogenase